MRKRSDSDFDDIGIIKEETKYEKDPTPTGHHGNKRVQDEPHDTNYNPDEQNDADTDDGLPYF